MRCRALSMGLRIELEIILWLDTIEFSAYVWISHVLFILLIQA